MITARHLLKLLLVTGLLVPLGVMSAEPLSPAALVASPDGKTLYVACAAANRVLRFDTAANKVARLVETLP
ncbi:MAG: hypothetical protein N2689_15580, partial [Verrucomicrobiae bacterium]|nr:hypothetical protein [Verrucomicrobiae bacterium]